MRNRADIMEDLDSDLYEANTHPFVLKIWLEVAPGDGRRAVWRGHITHVLSGERRYVQDLKDIVSFLVPYLEAMGVDVELPWSERGER